MVPHTLDALLHGGGFVWTNGLPNPWVTVGREAGAGRVVTVLYFLFSPCDANKKKFIAVRVKVV